MLKKKKPPNKHQKTLKITRGHPYKFSPRLKAVKKVQVKKNVTRKSRSIFSVKNVGFCFVEGLQGDQVFSKCQELTKKFVKPYIPIAVEYFVYPLFKCRAKRCCCTTECRYDCPGKAKTKDFGCICTDDDIRTNIADCCTCTGIKKAKKNKVKKTKTKKVKEQKEQKQKKTEVCVESPKFVGCPQKKKRSCCFKKRKKKKTTICWCSLSASGKSEKNIQIGIGNEKVCQCGSEEEFISEVRSEKIIPEKVTDVSVETDCRCSENNLPCKHCLETTKSTEKACHVDSCQNSSHEIRSEGLERDYCPCCKAPLTPELRSNLNSWKAFNQTKNNKQIISPNNSNNHGYLFQRSIKYAKECVCKTDTSISID